MLSSETPASPAQVATPTVASRPLTELRPFALVALLTLLVDQGSKALVRRSIPLNSELPLVPGWVHFSHVVNRGAAWNMLTGQRYLLIGVSVAVIFAVGSAARDVTRRGWLATMALGLILGGALGNLTDRIASGAVTDFIDLDTGVQWIRNFPVFNVADSALSVGVALFVIDIMLLNRPRGFRS